MESSLAVVQPRDDELRLEGWPRHEGDEGARRLRRGRPRGHGGGIGGDFLQLPRQRPHERHTLHGQDLADLMHAQLGLTLHDRLRGVAARPEDGLVLDRVGDAQALENTGEVNPAGGPAARIRVDERLRGQHRPLERLDGRDVGKGGALAHGDPDGRPRQVGPRVGDDEPLRRELLQHGVRDDDHVRHLTRLHFLPQLPRGPGGDDDGVPRFLPERLRELGHDALHGPGAQHLDLGGVDERRPGTYAQPGHEEGQPPSRTLCSQTHRASWSPMGGRARVVIR